MISVIVPVYNVEQYLDECVKSILSQTYKDFELILVNDGSTDNSGIMCDEYAAKDGRIKVIHKDNGGLSDARNAGTRVAAGETITYIDSDDVVSKNHLEILHTMLEKNGGDISVTGISKFYKNSNLDVAKKIDKIYVLSGVEALESMLYQDLLDTSACSILLQSAIAKAKENMFPIGKYHEDDYTTYKYYGMAQRVVTSKVKTYFYRQREYSITHSWGKANIDELEASDHLVAYCEEKYPLLVGAAKSKKFSNYCQLLMQLCEAKGNNKYIYEKIVSYLKEVRWDILFDSKCRIKNRFAAAICCLGIPAFELISEVMNLRKKHFTGG